MGQGDPHWLTFRFPPLPLLVQLSFLLPTTFPLSYLPLALALLPPLSESLVWRVILSPGWFLCINTSELQAGTKLT